VKGRCLNRL